jgi:hypothetical protein
VNNSSNSATRSGRSAVGRVQAPGAQSDGSTISGRSRTRHLDPRPHDPPRGLTLHEALEGGLVDHHVQRAPVGSAEGGCHSPSTVDRDAVGDGAALVGTLPGALGRYAHRTAKRNVQKGVSATLPTAWATIAFCNGMTRAQRRFALARFCPESPSMVLENVDRSGMPDDMPRTWILTLRDRALSVKTQRNCIAALWGVQTLIEIDTCLCLMISEPKRLSEILVERCRLYV